MQPEFGRYNLLRPKSHKSSCPSKLKKLFVRSNSSVTGMFESEHPPLDIGIQREDDGTVTMRFPKPEQSPLDRDYTYTITPDGHGILTDCRVQARQHPGISPAAAPRTDA